MEKYKRQLKIKTDKIYFMRLHFKDRSNKCYSKYINKHHLMNVKENIKKEKSFLISTCHQPTFIVFKKKEKKKQYKYI